MSGLPGEPNENFEPRVPDISDEMDERLRKIEQASKEAKAKYLQTRPEDVRESLKPKAERRESSNKGLGLGMVVAYAIIGVPVMFYGIGFLIDQQMKTEYWKSGLTMLGLVAALAWTIYTVQKHQGE